MCGIIEFFIKMIRAGRIKVIDIAQIERLTGFGNIPGNAVVIYGNGKSWINKLLPRM